MASDNIIINADGTITRRDASNNNGGSSDNTGCIWAVIIAVCIIVGIVIAANSNSSDNSYSEPEKVVSEVVSNNSSKEEETYVEETSNEATYLSVSESSVIFDSDGGSIDIDISTDGEWEIGTSTADWGHLSKHSSSVTLRVGSYSGDEDRTDWFTIKAGDYEERIEITQHADNEPSANIERVWVDHNEYNNGYKGMLIHVEFTTENLLGKTVYVYAYFYQSDNQTPLHNQYGDKLYFYGTGSPSYKSARFGDFKIFVPYVGLNMAPGVSGDFSFDIEVKDGSGTLYDRDENNSFTFSSGG
jgi:hypothetical protein